MADRTHKGRAGDTSGLSSGEDRPAEATFGASGTTPSGVPVDSGNVELVPPSGEDEPRGSLEAALEAAAAEAAAWRDKGMRAQAEYENTRRRLEARHTDALLRAAERVVEALFPVMDDLERAIDHALGENPEMAEGLSAVHRKLAEIIGREGCTPVDPLGSAFDAEKHHAVQMREDVDVPDHTVVEVFQKGYEMHGRVLRPAMVVVSTGGPAREE